MDKLRFGTAGIPLSAKGLGSQEGIKKVRELGLDSMELEFVHSVNLSEEKAYAVKEEARKNDVVLTCHAPYYINLNSPDKAKLKASIGRILNSARILNAAGGWSVCMHAAFYMKSDDIHKKLKPEFEKIVKTLKNEGNNVWIRPEIGGKRSQYGSLEEIIKMCQEVEQMMPCIDYAHFHARDNGGKTHKDFIASLVLLEKELGKEALKNMHMHVEGIEYSDKGEKNHLNLEKSDFKWKELLQALKEFDAKGVLICESPNIENDALMMQKFYKSL